MGLLHKAADLVTSLGVGGITDSVVTTIPLVSVTGFSDGDLVQVTVDRLDSNGISTPIKREVIRGTVNGLNLINCTRAVEGSAQAHATGALVECIHTANTHNQLNLYVSEFQFPGLHNGKVVVSNPGGVLTASIKTLLNADPSPNAPVRVIVNNELRTITTPLTVTVPAGLNAFNTGSAEMATLFANYFIFIGVSNTNKTALGIARFPYYRTGSQFIDTVNSQYYGRFADTDGTVLAAPSQVNSVVCIDRIRAIQSGGAGYTWSAAGNVYNSPILRSEEIPFAITPQAQSGATYAVNTAVKHSYFIENDTITVTTANIITFGGTTYQNFILGLPAIAKNVRNSGLGASVNNKIARTSTFDTNNLWYLQQYDGVVIPVGSWWIEGQLTYQI